MKKLFIYDLLENDKKLLEFLQTNNLLSLTNSLGALNEKYVTAINDDIRPYIDIIWDMCQLAYAKIGGFKTASSKEELLKKVELAKMVRRGDKIVAVVLYKDLASRKTIAGATDGTDAGKLGLYNILQEDIKLERAWGECSEALEHLMFKFGGVPIPNTFAAKLTGKEILRLDADGYHYDRMIGGEVKTKIIFGNVPKDKLENVK